ncbi:MAG: YcjX family protein [Magnetococcales bacterium]|nr:YcjX family protein [Magnetococcales bacterium]NGZ05844.1 YcjX family protein [Magnetococcales bacterium]
MKKILKDWTPERLSRQVGQIGSQLDDWWHLSLDRTVRLAVTGLNQSGKTVFTTTLIHHLLHALQGSNLPALKVADEERLLGTRIMPQPDLDIPTFSYERYIRALLAHKPTWPVPTESLSEIRLAIRFRPAGMLSRKLSTSATLYLDIIDYPGEWLLDLPMLKHSFDSWSAFTLKLCEEEPRRTLAARWLDHLTHHLNPSDPANDEVVRQVAELYTDFLLACKKPQVGLTFLQPGRFTIPGDLKGAPLLTFCPLPPPGADGVKAGSIREAMVKRFESYQKLVAEGFLKRHFSRFDRQIVLLDLLGALNRGPTAFADMHTSLEAILENFKRGPSSLLTRLFSPRIDRLLFAATKADYVAANQHQNMERLLRRLVARSANDAAFLGVEIQSQAMAALRCTRTVQRDHNGRRLSFVQGTPKGRERETLLFPGEIPDALPEADEWGAHRFHFMEFEPRRPPDAEGPTPPHIRLDQALEFLLGDKLQ